MAVRRTRDPWHLLWHAAIADTTLAILLVVAAITLAVASMIPQVSPDDSVILAQQMWSIQARFGGAAGLMRDFGLFSVAQSWFFRALVGLLFGCVLLRLIEAVDRLRMSLSARPSGSSPVGLRRLWPQAFDIALAVLLHAAALILAVGLAMAQVWGWQRQGIVLQQGSRVVLPGRDSWASMTADGRVTHSAGLRVLVDERGPGALIRVTNSAGEPVPLQQNPGSRPAPEIALPLIRDPDLDTREAIVAIPEAQLVLRLAPRAGDATEDSGALVIQGYRSPSGELAMEAVVEGDVSLPVGDVLVEIAAAPYARVSAVRNPGAWPTAVGITTLICGLAVAVARRIRSAQRSARRGCAPVQAGTRQRTARNRG